MVRWQSPWWGGVMALAMMGCGGDDDATANTPVSPGSCPPEAPFGTEQGNVAPDVTLYDCDGQAVQLRDLCPRQGALLYAFAAW